MEDAPNIFQKNTSMLHIFDQDGYPIYRRRDDSRIVSKNGIELDNRYMV